MLRSFQVWLPTTSSNCEAYWTLHLFAQPLLPKLFSTCRIQGRRIRRTRRTRSRRTRTRRTRRASPQRCSMALMGLALKNKNELVHDNKRICFHRMALKQSVPPLWCLSWLLQWFCLLFPHVFVHRKNACPKWWRLKVLTRSVTWSPHHVLLSIDWCYVIQIFEFYIVWKAGASLSARKICLTCVCSYFAGAGLNKIRGFC